MNSGVVGLMQNPTLSATSDFAMNSEQVGWEPYLPERSMMDDPDQQTYASATGALNYGAPPLRIARLWRWGLRANTSANNRSHGHPMHADTLRLPPPVWSNPTRSYRSVSVQSSKYGIARDQIQIPSVFVPVAAH